MATALPKNLPNQALPRMVFILLSGLQAPHTLNNTQCHSIRRLRTHLNMKRRDDIHCDHLQHRDSDHEQDLGFKPPKKWSLTVWNWTSNPWCLRGLGQAWPSVCRASSLALALAQASSAAWWPAWLGGWAWGQFRSPWHWDIGTLGHWDISIDVGYHPIFMVTWGKWGMVYHWVYCWAYHITKHLVVPKLHVW